VSEYLLLTQGRVVCDDAKSVITKTEWNSFKQLVKDYWTDLHGKIRKYCLSQTDKDFFYNSHIFDEEDIELVDSTFNDKEVFDKILNERLDYLFEYGWGNGDWALFVKDFFPNVEMNFLAVWEDEHYIDYVDDMMWFNEEPEEIPEIFANYLIEYKMKHMGFLPPIAIIEGMKKYIQEKGFSNLILEDC